MVAKVKDIVSLLPPDYTGELLPSIREEFVKSDKTIIVLDDDPTGTQTCYDVTVLTSWSVALITKELTKKPSILFILTNSRSMSGKAAVQLTTEIGQNLKEAVELSGREIVVISRSDSTLRGHFPVEVDAISMALHIENAVWILVPAFIEGGRLTIDDVHYLVEHEELVPVADTPFARDTVFGYTHSNLKAWVEEKTNGRVKAEEVISISLEDIRLGGPQGVSGKLRKCSPGKICIVNACNYRDLEVFAMGVILAENAGQKFLYRSSASFVPIRAGMAAGRLYIPEKEITAATNGSLVVVGSHVPKTSSQLQYLLTQGEHQSIEVNVPQLLTSDDFSDYAAAIIHRTDQWIASGKDVVIHTSRKLEVGKDADGSLQINALVSSFLVSIIKGLTARPMFIVAKGGITSSDLATKGLLAEKALILGQVIPGVPVWRLDHKSKFPEILFVVFPGNVGDERALAQVCNLVEG